MNDKSHAYFHIETPTTRFEKSVMLATEDIQHFLKIKKPIRSITDVEDFVRMISPQYSIAIIKSLNDNQERVKTLLENIGYTLFKESNIYSYRAIQTFSFFMRLPKDIFYTEYTRFQQKGYEDSKILKTLANRFLVDYEECEYYANNFGLTRIKI